MSKVKVAFKETLKPKANWREEMSREQKAYKNKWNTEKKPYTPTPKQKKESTAVEATPANS